MVCCKKFIIMFLILLILLFNFTFCFAVEDIPQGYNYINQNLLFANSKISLDGEILNTDNSNIYYIDISNFSDILYFNTQEIRYSFTDSIDLVTGDFVNAPTVVSSNTNGIYLDVSNITSNYILFTYYTDNVVDVYGKGYTAMADGIQGLVDNVGPNALWGVFGSGIDFVYIVVIVAFGLFIIYKLIKGLSKAKSKI